MITLAQSVRVRGTAGEPIPTVWKSLEDTGIIFRRGQLVLVAAGPGTGKSVLALTMSLQSAVPSLMFSADSDAFTQLSRAIANLCGIPLSIAQDMVLAQNVPGEVKAIPLRIDYSASPSTDDIQEILMAYWEVYGFYPSVVIVDNLTNVVSDMTDNGDPFSGLEGLMDFLHGMARETSACVVVLHHVTGEYNNGDKAIPLNGVKGQITRVPEMVLTIHRKPGYIEDHWILCVSPVKNRGGRPDPTGTTFAELHFVGGLMSVSDLAPEIQDQLTVEEWAHYEEGFDG